MNPSRTNGRLAEIDDIDPDADAKTLPTALEDRVVAELADAGLLRPPKRWPIVLAWAASLALALGAGFLLSHTGQIETGSRDSGSRYMLLLYEDAAFETAVGDAARERVAEYGGWLDGLERRGIIARGDELAPAAHVLATAGRPAPPSRRPSREARLSGYFVIEAQSLDDATTIARTCPHLRHGGTLAVHPIIDH